MEVITRFHGYVGEIFLEPSPEIYFLLMGGCWRLLNSGKITSLNTKLLECLPFGLKDRGPLKLDFWMLRGCYEDFAVYVGRKMRLSLEEEPLHRHL